MKTSIKQLLLALLLCSAGHAQDVKKTKLWGGFGHFGFSGEQLNLNDLNKTLTASNYKSFSNFSYSMGGGGSFVFNNIVVGGGGAWLLNSTTKNASNSAALNGGYGYFGVGYVVYSNEHSLLYPTLNVGGGGYDLFISKANPPSDFSQQLNAPAGTLTASAGGWMINPQITYMHFLGKGENHGFLLGLRAGYKYSPYNWNIKMNDVNLNNAPGINMNGFYVSLLLGGGGFDN